MLAVFKKEPWRYFVSVVASYVLPFVREFFADLFENMRIVGIRAEIPEAQGDDTPILRCFLCKIQAVIEVAFVGKGGVSVGCVE